MKNNRLAIVVIVGVALVLIFWIKQYFSPERVVHRKFVAAVVAFEKEQLLGTVQVISRTYHDPWGQSYESIAGNIELEQQMAWRQCHFANLGNVPGRNNQAS